MTRFRHVVIEKRKAHGKKQHEKHLIKSLKMELAQDFKERRSSKKVFFKIEAFLLKKLNQFLDSSCYDLSLCPMRF